MKSSGFVIITSTWGVLSSIFNKYSYENISFLYLPLNKLKRWSTETFSRKEERK